jgi:cytochrome c-L
MMMKMSRLFFALMLSVPVMASAGQSFSSTADGKTLEIPAAAFDTPAAKAFLETGKNGYIGDQAAAKAGKKVYQLYSCAQCHGPVGNGQVGPNLRDDGWNYAKNATDKGLFETIWGGTAGGMGAKGKGLMLADDPSQGLTPDEILKVAAFLRTNIDAAPAPASADATKAPTAVDAAAASVATSSAVAKDSTAAKDSVKQAVKKTGKKVSSKAKVKKASAS